MDTEIMGGEVREAGREIRAGLEALAKAISALVVQAQREREDGR